MCFFTNMLGLRLSGPFEWLVFEMEEGEHSVLIHYSKGVYVVLIPSYRKGHKDILIFWEVLLLFFLLSVNVRFDVRAVEKNVP